MVGEIFSHTLGVRSHSIFPLLPVGRTDLAIVGADKLEGLKHTHSFVYGAANREAVDSEVHNNPIAVNMRNVSGCLLSFTFLLLFGDFNKFIFRKVSFQIMRS